MPAFAAAHRGLSAEHPENTVAAFQAAAASGFAAQELDLRATADGEIVVLHDPGLERTTDGNGRVADMRYDDLRNHRTPAGPVPRLDDVLRALADWDGLWNLELKAVAAAEGASHLVRHHGLEGRVLFSSFDPKALSRVRNQLPDAPRALIAGGEPDGDDVAEARRLACRWLNVDQEALTRRVAEGIRAEGFRLGSYTVNDPARARALAGWGVECIITDRREVLAAVADPRAPRPYF